jgi:hypothetical protein
MARLPKRGVSVASPSGNEADFKRVLVDLCPHYVFSDSTVQELYALLGRVVGRWWAEKARLEASSVANALAAISRNLEAVAKSLGGRETGVRHAIDVEIVEQIEIFLALDPTVGSLEGARVIMASLRQDAAKVAHASLVAASDLKNDVGKSGRPRLEWYDDFTALLFRIAELAGVEPTLGKDRISGKRTGWLFRAGQALEGFLLPEQLMPEGFIRPGEMRSETPEACWKRLQRSKKRIASRVGQNLAASTP